MIVDSGGTELRLEKTGEISSNCLKGMSLRSIGRVIRLSEAKRRLTAFIA